MLELTDSTIEAAIAENDIILIDFWADWCQPCKVMEPTLERLDEMAEHIQIGKLNVDLNGNAYQKHGVMALPTFILFRHGEEIARFVGARGLMNLYQDITLALQQIPLSPTA